MLLGFRWKPNGDFKVAVIDSENESGILRTGNNCTIKCLHLNEQQWSATMLDLHPDQIVNYDYNDCALSLFTFALLLFALL